MSRRRGKSLFVTLIFNCWQNRIPRSMLYHELLSSGTDGLSLSIIASVGVNLKPIHVARKSTAQNQLRLLPRNWDSPVLALVSCLIKILKRFIVLTLFIDSSGPRLEVGEASLSFVEEAAPELFNGVNKLTPSHFVTNSVTSTLHRRKC